MTPREIAAWMIFHKDEERKEAAFRLQLAAIAAQGDSKAISGVVKSLLEDE